jgi:hypothetical protein
MSGADRRQAALPSDDFVDVLALELEELSDLDSDLDSDLVSDFAAGLLSSLLVSAPLRLSVR